MTPQCYTRWKHYQVWRKSYSSLADLPDSSSKFLWIMKLISCKSTIIPLSTQYKGQMIKTLYLNMCIMSLCWLDTRLMVLEEIQRLSAAKTRQHNILSGCSVKDALHPDSDEYIFLHYLMQIGWNYAYCISFWSYLIPLSN